MSLTAGQILSSHEREIHDVDHKVILLRAKQRHATSSSSCSAAAEGVASIANVWQCSVPKIMANSRRSGTNSS